MSKPGEFEIGLVLAGAISGGAYTAGVLDFFLEALEAWEDAKANNPGSVPDHSVRIKALAGSSAGAMTAAIFIRALATKVTPVPDVNLPPSPPPGDLAQPQAQFSNPFFTAWVQCIDIKHLLGGRDLEREDAPVVSILDSTVLADIGNSVLNVTDTPRATPPTYADGPVDLFLTSTNLRGVPYGFGFLGETTGYRHMMTAYADHMQFRLEWPSPHGAEDTGSSSVILEPAKLAPSDTWAVMMNAALASGAFPIGLAPRRLSRPATDYDRRTWKIPPQNGLQTVPEAPGEKPRRVPLELSVQRAIVTDPAEPRALRPLSPTTQEIMPGWPAGIQIADPAKRGADPAYVYEYFNVDGGLMNNEPLELVRNALAVDGRNPRDGKTADRAVIMVDPFPNTSNVTAEYENSISLIGIIVKMFSALKEQARFKPEDLVLALDPYVYSRYVVAPIYSAGNNKVTVPAMASAVMGGFGGFFCEAFRRHDYQLGRRNCQRFLQSHFAMPIENKLFDGWRGSRALQGYTFEEAEDNGQITRFAPIIPLVPRLNPYLGVAAEIPLPPRPTAKDVDLVALRKQIRSRLDLVIPRLIASVPLVGARIMMQLLWFGAKLLGQRDKIVDLVMDKITSEIAVLK
ncbi:MAG: hypothetical protein AB7M05_08935 [Alphaproteobacteria bacterium]